MRTAAPFRKSSGISSYINTVFRLRTPLPWCLLLFLLFSCGKLPLSGATEKKGSLEIRTCVLKNGQAKTSLTLSTAFDSLIIEVRGPDMAPIHFAKPFDPSRLTSNDTLANVPAGDNRQLRVFTCDRAGTTITMDSVSRRIVRIDPNSLTQCTVVLFPVAGSIYLCLENIPTKVDSIFVSFAAPGRGPWVARTKRNSKVFLSIDKIPTATSGTLSVVAVDSVKDTLYLATKTFTFDAMKMETLTLNFSSMPGRLAFSTIIVMPGATSASGTIAVSDTSVEEGGELIITEIMYAANDSEYVEVYNPGTSDRSYDSLCIDIDGTCRWFTDITVGGQKTFVFGRRLLPWTDAAHPVAGALDLSSSGNWITLRSKNGRIIDRVIFTGGINSLEWPNVSGKQSIALDSSIDDAKLNGFGRNWNATTTLIPGSTSQYGTPRIR